MSTTEPSEPIAYRPGDVANNHVLAPDGITWILLPPPSAAPQPKSPLKHKGWWIAAGVLGLLVAIGAALPNSPSVEVTDITYSVINPSTLKVAWTMHGEPGDTVNCHVHATDPSHHYDGSDYAINIELGTTGGRIAWIPLGIDNEGAVFVTEVTVEC